MTRARDLANIADGTFTATDLDLSGTLTVSGDATFDTNTLFVDVSTDRVGIGTTSPAAQLDIGGATEGLYVRHPNADELTVRFDNYGTTGTDAGPSFRMNDQTGVTRIQLNARQGSTRDSFINSGGNFGIGTDSPDTVLHVGESGNAGTVEFRLFNSEGNVGMATNNGSLLFVQNNGTEAMRINSSGNVGIGTSSPVRKLQVGDNTGGEVISIQSSTSTKGSIYFGDNTATSAEYAGVLRYDHADDSMQFWTSSSERMRIDSSGSVGIGTSNPNRGILTLEGANYVLTNSGQALGGIHINADTAPGAGGYTNGISFGYTAGSSAIVGVTSDFSSDSDRQGLAFIVHSSATGATDAVEAMRIHANGNVGIGTTSPQEALHIQPASNAGANVQGIMLESPSVSDAIGIVFRNAANVDYASIYFNDSGDALAFNNNTAERMRIDPVGRLLVNNTNLTGGYIAVRQGTYYGIQSDTTSAGAGVGHVVFTVNGSTVGTITTSGTSTAYNTSSDYRLKDVDGPVTNSGAYIDALKPVQGSWKADGSRFIGLIAHEVQEVSETPIATGEKDGEEMQGMDYSAPELIANLIAEIQSLRARVAQLEGA